MSNQTLRELAKDYARGIIDKENYRKSRAELIVGITAGKIAVKAIDYPPPLTPSDAEKAITENIQRDKTEITPSNNNKPTSTQQSTTAAKSTTPEKNKKSPVLFISVSAVIVILLIIGVVLFYPKPPGSGSVTTADKSTTVETSNTVATSSMAGESLIADFLTKKNWNEDSLDTFLNSWTALTEAERDTARQTKRMKRMHDSIYKQFLEEKALASIDSEKAGIKQQKLIEFANAIGINDTRLVIDIE